MMDEFRTADSVLEWIERKVRTKEPISPGLWVEAAQYMNILSGEEQARLYELQQVVAKKRVEILESGKPVSYAKSVVEASDEYKDYLLQKGKIERIIEAVRIAKLQARMASDELKGY